MFPSIHYAEVVLLQLAVWNTVTGSESPMFVNVVSFKAVSEDTPVNTTLFTLTATDQDGPEQLLFTIPTTHPSYLIIWLNNVRGDSKTGRMVDVLLKSPLDRDFTNQQTVRLLFAVQDSSTMETANRINQGVELLILDVNDENPTFNQSRYELSVLESTTLDSSVMTLKASDPDSNPQLRYFMEPVGQAVSDMYRNSFVIEPLTGQIKVNRKLDYNVNNFYEFTLMVNDNGGNGGRNGTASLLIKIIDVQDKPPYFINLPYRVNILENATIGTKVLQVTAFDGDKGVPNTSVSYSFDSGDTSLFAINNDTGDITVKSQLDRDNPNIQQTGGVYALGVKATENNNNQPANMTTAVTLVTIKVDDVNDNSPTFPLRVYQAFILENMQEGVPITFNSPAVMNVSDIDQGLNSHFALSLEMNGKLYTDFSPLPSEVYSESSVLIQVRNQSVLDFELLPEITFQIIAREIGTDELRSGSATIVLKIIDMNDNSPIFDPNMKTSLSILENSTSGTELTTLYATDLDSGNNGKITYNIRGSNSVLNVNATSGRVTLTGQLNREVVDRYLLTAEAKDGGGLITFVTLNVTVLDVNDVRPSFTRDEYYVTVPEDRTEFLRGDLVVKAIDDDEPNSPNSRVHYRIKSASAGLAGKFAVDNTSGLVTMVARIDYESLPVSVAGRAGPVLVEIEAYDLGIPSLATSINITVEVEDVNDNAPTFNKTFYSASVSEMAVAGMSVIQVFASDSDRTPPNNQFLYRIDSGASDKFRINFQTGEITVEVGARLDYESVPKYVLNITATDRGAVPQEGLCVVEISILDENDEAPVFIPTSVTTAVSENTLPVTGSESPMFVNVVSFKAVSEDTPVNTTLFTLTATDQDGPEQLLFTIPTTHPSYLIIWLNNVRGDSKTGRMVDVLLKSPLDRDFTNQQTVRLLFAVQDSSTMETANRINQGVELLILDVNDENPTFNQSRYELSVLESTTLDSSVMTLKASDPDSNPQLRYFMEPVGQAVSDVYRNSFVIEPLTGQIKVNRKLDYNVNNFYEFTLMVNDNGGNGGRNGTLSLLIKIIDVQDKPPYFINLPYRVNILENATIGTKVLQVTAFDGDKGVPNTSVSYSFDSGDTSLFAINNDTGDITVKSQLDRDNPNIQQTGGVYALGVKATENNNNQPANMTTAVTLVTIKVDDVNDNSPTFPLRVYQASILENMQEGVPITFNSPAVMNVSDIDQGLNSHFALSLEMNGKLYTDFSPLPSEVYSESSVLIQVRNQSVLDFELLPEITFQIIAREIGTDELRSGSATIVLKIIDMNDNSPIFDPNMKTSLSILENSTSGTELTTLYATDLDSGNNGKITYNIRGSNSVLNVNATSGRVTLTGQLNREVVDRYLLTAEAKDGGGLITFVTLNVTVLDVNDVRPSFTRDEYYVTVPEDRTEFLRGDLVVKAIDDDEPNSPNSRVHYRIKSASAGLAGKFAVDNTSGLVTMVARIDYESLPVSVAGRAGPVLVEIEAYDLGIPSLATSINITVEVEDVNDNAPTFNKTFYSASVSEMAVAGMSVIQVFASDSDRTPPNNQFLYRIDSGASDKFRINFQTGEITVEVGARLDYESVPKYVLNITATDRGAVPQEGLCVVEISILDENDEAPVFIPTSVTTAVSENTLPGGEVKCLTAVDLDSNPVLVYSLLPSSVLGYDESGRAVNVTSTGAQNYFKINSTSGCIQVQSKLDRETVELVILKAIVVDTQAVSGHINQTATGTVTITVSDYNDNAPQFIPNNTYSLLISEGLNLHSEVMRFETRDLDKQQQVSYRIHMDPYGNFDITPSTGILRLKSRLDRETYPSIQLRVLAVDSGLPQLTSTAVVSVTVQDINDNSPVFLPYELQYSVREDDAPDTVICRLSATDADLGEYGRIEYKFEVSNDDGRLKINKTTGAISVASLLDREKRNSYNLYVQANDNPGTPEDQRTNQTKTIIIKVTDVNDNDPAFTNIEENTRPSVLENDSPGRVVFTVSADDLDEGVNAELQYSLSGDPESLFTLKNINRNISGIPKYFGEISVAKSLIGESGTHQLVITVTDKGTSPRSANTTLIILVNDVNLHAPVFA